MGIPWRLIGKVIAIILVGWFVIKNPDIAIKVVSFVQEAFNWVFNLIKSGLVKLK